MMNRMTTMHEARYRYARLNHAYLNIEAIFSDETKNFVTPYDPNPGDAVQICLRTARQDAEGVFLHICEPLEKKHRMAVTKSDALFDYHAVTIQADAEPFRYFFSIQKHGRTYYYNKNGLRSDADPAYHFKIIPGFKVPEWARGAIMYQIFVDRFHNGDRTNDPKNFEYLYLGQTARFTEWYDEMPTGIGGDVCNFYGGDLQGIMDKMPYLKELGVEVLYLNPIFVSPSSHKYDAQDYDHIDPHFGKIVKDEGDVLSFEKLHNRYATKYISRTTDLTNLEASDALFVDFVKLAHENGIKVILDGVFNHCGSYNKWMDKAGFYGASQSNYPPGAYPDANSPYNDYFLWFDQHWPNNDCYDGWWGNDAQPKLNYDNSPALLDYIMGVARKWVSPPYNADGWRLDVAADLGRSPLFNHMFWHRFREEVKSANPEALILAEHYGDASAWLNGDQWDTIMNYDAFMEPLSWFLTGVSKHSEESRPHLKCDTLSFENAMRYYMARFTVHSLQTAMNELSNHDHSRFLTRTNGMTGRLHNTSPRVAEQNVNKSIMLEAVVFQMTWPGAPTLYYGDEAGMMGWTDPDNRRPYPWGKEDKDILEAHRALIKLRTYYPVLRTGSCEFLWNDYGFISFGRWDDDEKIVVVINNNAAPKEVTLPVWKMGCMEGVFTRAAATFDGRYHRSRITCPINSGSIRLTAPGQSALVLVYER